MRYLVLPFLLVLGLVELVLRCTALLTATALTFILGVLLWEDSSPGSIKWFLTPVCFDIAKQLVA